MLIFLDTETGGLDPQKHSLLEVGLVAYENGRIWDAYRFYLKEDGYVVTPGALHVNGIDLVQVHEQGIDAETAIQRIAHFAGKWKLEEKPMLVGHNIDFDRGFVDALFKRFGKTVGDVFSHRVIDTAGTIRFLKEAGVLEAEFPASLHKAARALGYEPHGEHTALGDVYTTIFLFEALMAKVRR